MTTVGLLIGCLNLSVSCTSFPSSSNTNSCVPYLTATNTGLWGLQQALPDVTCTSCVGIGGFVAGAFPTGWCPPHLFGWRGNKSAIPRCVLGSLVLAAHLGLAPLGPLFCFGGHLESLPLQHLRCIVCILHKASADAPAESIPSRLWVGMTGVAQLEMSDGVEHAGFCPPISVHRVSHKPCAHASLRLTCASAKMFVVPTSPCPLAQTQWLPEFCQRSQLGSQP